jgi:hypothetical protein
VYFGEEKSNYHNGHWLADTRSLPASMLDRCPKLITNKELNIAKYFCETNLTSKARDPRETSPMIYQPSCDTPYENIDVKLLMEKLNGTVLLMVGDSIMFQML